MGGPMRLSCTLEDSLGQITDTSGMQLEWPPVTLRILRSASPVSHRLWDVNIPRLFLFLFLFLAVSQQDIHSDTPVKDTSPTGVGRTVVQPWWYKDCVLFCWWIKWNSDVYMHFTLWESKQERKLWFTHVDIDIAVICGTFLMVE